MTQAQLAAAIGVTQPAVSGWIKGAVPDGVRLCKLAEFFGVSPAFLLSENPEPSGANADETQGSVVHHRLAQRRRSRQNVSPLENLSISLNGKVGHAELRELAEGLRKLLALVERMLGKR